MTSLDGLDRRLTARLDEHAAPRAPEGLNEAITESIAATAQRPAWATLERWIPMETRAQFGAVPRAVIVFALLTLLTLVVATAVAIGASNPPKLPPPFGPAANGLIAAELDGDIYVVDPEDGSRRQVSSGPAIDSSPSWSRNGRSLAYLSESEAGDEVSLVVTDLKGSETVAVASTGTGDLAIDPWIEWSADSTEIMYNAVDPALAPADCPYPADGMGRCGSRLYVVPADGSDAPHQVGDPNLDARGAALSPDGVTVAFGGGTAGSEALYLMDWDGSDVRELESIEDTTAYAAFAQQSWSADGERIVTHDDYETGTQKIWLVQADGSGSTQISEGVGPQFWPEFAPDGSAVLWSTGGTGIALWTPEGGQVRTPLTSSSEWSPDAQHFVTVRNRTLVVTDRQGEILLELGEADQGLATGRWQRVAE